MCVIAVCNYSALPPERLSRKTTRSNGTAGKGQGYNSSGCPCPQAPCPPRHSADVNTGIPVNCSQTAMNVDGRTTFRSQKFNYSPLFQPDVTTGCHELLWNEKRSCVIEEADKEYVVINDGERAFHLGFRRRPEAGSSHDDRLLL
ncbi:hypothetical protein HPB49_018969 [Dermacentor silvarum]|uniref:Uncharacterized protein n=1 Tax=Dermacentor silvarum TaxID=543639 RepID=A0ACB8D7N4_DERSI|nr:hypothetical protein HPB49_018969 [Dermacentor silvarum]